MGHGKETPRQKMIGMMYLFLTAMLALNVSKDVLNAFVGVNASVSKTIENYQKKNQKVYDDFEKAEAENPVKAKPWREKAFFVKNQADSLIDFIQSLKIEIIHKADGPEAPGVRKDGSICTDSILAKDQQEVPAEIMVVKGKGKIVKEKIVDFREFIIGMIDPKDSLIRNAIENNLETHDPPAKDGIMHTWESEHFEHLPLVAVITLMTKLQSDIRNAEADVINYLYNGIEAQSFKFNKLEAIVIPKSDYVLKGSSYEAEVMLAAFDTTQKPKVIVQGTELQINNKARGIFKRIGSAVGYQKWNGIVQIKAPDGGIRTYPFEGKYQVAEPNLVVSPTKMNVFYYGIENPVDISVPGVSSDKIIATASNANMRKEGNSYIIKPDKPGGLVTVKVMAEVSGEKRSMGEREFRVKIIPKPIAKVLGKSNGNISKNELLAAIGVDAILEDFLFDLKFNVRDFTVTTTIGGYTKELPQKGNKFSMEQKGIIRDLKPNSKLIIEEIKCVGPDGQTRELSPIVFKVK